VNIKEQVEHIIRNPEEWGEVGELYTGYSLLDKDGKPIKSAYRKSQSYTRWMGRLIQAMFSAIDVPLTDFQPGVYSPIWVAGSNQGTHLVAFPSDNINPGLGLNGGINHTGAFIGIGTGPLTGAQSQFTNLKTPFGVPVNARLGTLTTQEDGVAIEFASSIGITNNQSSSITVTEQGLFGMFHGFNEPVASVQHPTLMAYDEVNPGVVVAAGQVFVPKYVLRFAA
jgi:hypothetical protein